MNTSGRDLPEKTTFFSLQPSILMDGNESINGVVDLKKTFASKKSHDTTASQQNMDKHQISMVHPNDKIDESCLQDIMEFIDKIPQGFDLDISNIHMDHNISLGQIGKVEITPSVLFEKEKYVAQSNWLSEMELRCLIDYNNKKIKTVCRIKDAELQFENGSSFRLTKITKMKVLYHEYEKCICFTYDQLRDKKTVEIKFRIFVENDTKDDLYMFFSKIVVEKLILMDYSIDLKQGEDLEADKFMMVGEVYKRGQIMNVWNRRKLVLTDRIQSFKGEKCTFEMKNIKEIWTRFEVHSDNLIVKVRHGKEKTEIAIPMVNYSVKFCKDNWLYRIYRLLTS